MAETFALLEQRVAAAADLIASLRGRIALLERELASLHDEIAASGTSSEPDTSAGGGASAAAPPGRPACDPAVLEELARLRAERGVVRERIRELMKEIDRVSW